MTFDNSPAQREELLSLLVSNHTPSLRDNPEGGDGAHVAEVWEDGELTYTKGGSLYGQRGLHCISPGHPLLVRDPLPLPTEKNYAGHNCVVLPHAIARQVEQILWGTK